ncbi:MAG: PTS sugar transporter subunit IIA [Planctomycetota bacterium]
MKLSDFVAPEAIVPELSATTRDDAVAELIDALVAADRVPADLRDDLIQHILDREKQGSTGFGKGVAVPHVKHDKVDAMTAAVGVSHTGVEFNALDKAPVFSIVLLVSPKNDPDPHLQAMESIFAHLQNDTFRKFLRQATTVDAVTDLLQEADSQQLA